VFDPAEILTTLDTEIKIALKQDTSDNSDGMDACMVLIEESETGGKHITYSGAKRALFCFKNGQMQALPAARKPIGGFRGRMNIESFKNHEIDLSAGDTIYLTSDGYTDQSNPDRKRFGTEKLFGILREIHSKPMEIQAQRLISELDNFAGGFPQRDDITVVGVKF
jgi:serine phosphatase RsbU (regulator of sigma subunit)